MGSGYGSLVIDNATGGGPSLTMTFPITMTFVILGTSDENRLGCFFNHGTIVARVEWGALEDSPPDGVNHARVLVSDGVNTVVAASTTNPGAHLTCIITCTATTVTANWVGILTLTADLTTASPSPLATLTDALNPFIGSINSGGGGMQVDSMDVAGLTAPSGPTDSFNRAATSPFAFNTPSQTNVGFADCGLPWFANFSSYPPLAGGGGGYINVSGPDSWADTSTGSDNSDVTLLLLTAAATGQITFPLDMRVDIPNIGTSHGYSTADRLGCYFNLDTLFAMVEIDGGTTIPTLTLRDAFGNVATTVGGALPDAPITAILSCSTTAVTFSVAGWGSISAALSAATPTPLTGPLTDAANPMLGGQQSGEGVQMDNLIVAGLGVVTDSFDRPDTVSVAGCTLGIADCGLLWVPLSPTPPAPFHTPDGAIVSNRAYLANGDNSNSSVMLLSNPYTSGGVAVSPYGPLLTGYGHV